jgi:LPS-assembly protein
MPGYISAEQKVKMLAANVDSLNENDVEATGDVVIYSPEYVLKADRALYHRDSGEIELFGRVNVIKGGEVYAISDYVKINLSTDVADFETFMAINQESHTWMKSKKANYKDGVYQCDAQTLTSSCSADSPTWSIWSSSTRYDTNEKWLSLYNPVFFVKDVPVFYLPYFGYSTNKERRSGLLKPSFGYMSEDGFFYQQPIFIAPALGYDFEITPQYRSLRGEGIYGTLRFKDTQYSDGHIKIGTFKDKSDYQKDKDLKYNNHYGYELFYNRSKLFSSGDDQDGLYLDFRSIRDIDYINLQGNEQYGSTATLQTSRFNYFYRKDKDYLGLYAKYFQDTSKDDNDNTLQTLPTLHYHRFITPLLSKHLYYSFDARFVNHTREEGLGADQFEFNIPLTLTFPLFDDYLQFSASENIYYTAIHYDTDGYANASYKRNYHKLSLTTELSKPYRKLFHTVNFGLDLTLPSLDKKRGYFADFVTLNSEDKSVKASLEQRFYDEYGNDLLYHRMSQIRNLESDKYILGELENEIRYRLNDHLSLSNRLLYSHEHKSLSLVNSGISYSDSRYDIALSHYYSDNHQGSKREDVSLSGKARVNVNMKLFGSLNYDNQNRYVKTKSIGLSYGKRCWDYTVQYKEDTIPQLTSNGETTAIHNKTVLLEFRFNPIGAFMQEFSSSDSGN